LCIWMHFWRIMTVYIRSQLGTFSSAWLLSWFFDRLPLSREQHHYVPLACNCLLLNLTLREVECDLLPFLFRKSAFLLSKRQLAKTFGLPVSTNGPKWGLRNQPHQQGNVHANFFTKLLLVCLLIYTVPESVLKHCDKAIMDFYLQETELVGSKDRSCRCWVVGPRFL